MTGPEDGVFRLGTVRASAGVGGDLADRAGPDGR